MLRLNARKKNSNFSIKILGLPKNVTKMLGWCSLYKRFFKINFNIFNMVLTANSYKDVQVLHVTPITLTSSHMQSKNNPRNHELWVLVLECVTFNHRNRGKTKVQSKGLLSFDLKIYSKLFFYLNQQKLICWTTFDGVTTQTLLITKPIMLPLP